MAMNWILAATDFLWDNGRKILRGRFDKVEKPTDYDIESECVMDKFVGLSHGNHKREALSSVGTPPFLGEPNLDSYVASSHGKRKREVIFPVGGQSLFGKTNLKHRESILAWLMDDKVKIIGLFGMGGCGKTTLAIHVYNDLLIRDVTPFPVWVTVGMDFGIAKLQQSISKAVGLNLECENNEMRRAAILHRFFSNREYVLILDDLWGYFSFADVGIPFSKGCKVIITTRLFSVCRSIGCQKTVKTGMLEADEAWKLFCRVLGDEALIVDEVRHLAELVSKECDGLPLALVQAARSLKGVKDVLEWRRTLERMKSISTEHDFLVTELLYRKLHPSYARLTNANVKQCLIYCTLYPKDIKFQREELIQLWISMGLIDEYFHGSNTPLQAQYDKGHTIVNNLVDCSLLESCEDGHDLKMHNVVRGMAIRIAREQIGMRLFVSHHAESKDLLKALEYMEDLHAVSLMSNISEIPSGSSPKFHKLLILLLQQNPLKKVPDSFFLCLPSLRVLDLSNTDIQSLPNTICNLKHLRSMRLRSCRKLTDVPPLHNLRALRFLDLGYCAIRRIPCGIENLKMLRELDLSYSPKLKELDTNLLSQLRSLTRIAAAFDNIGGYNCYIRSRHCESLHSFHLQVVDAAEQEQLFNEVSCHSNIVSFYGCSLAGETEDVLFPCNLHHLYYNKCEGLGILCDILSWKPIIYDFLSRDRKPDTKEIFKDVRPVNLKIDKRVGEKWNSENTNLHSSKYLLDVDKKSGIIVPHLKTCRITWCHDLEGIFTSTQIKGFQSLEILEIMDCTELRELILEEDSDRCQLDYCPFSIELPKLKRLELTRLPKLTNIYSGILLCTSLLCISIDECPKLTRLPFCDVWGDSLVLNQAGAKLSLQHLLKPKSSPHSTSISGDHEIKLLS